MPKGICGVLPSLDCIISLFIQDEENHHDKYVYKHNNVPDIPNGILIHIYIYIYIVNAPGEKKNAS